MSEGIERENLLSEKLDVRHACPECDVGRPQPFCKTCHGEGLLTELQLMMWERNRQAGF